uniref:Uncharacterized protein n=1 Tax=Scophthalmus maximus TaxID=52904 RepID=A0A8D3CX21_SCOMX
MTWSRSAKCKGVVPPGARSSSSRREGAGHKVIGRFISSWGLGLAACEPRESKWIYWGTFKNNHVLGLCASQFIRKKRGGGVCLLRHFHGQHHCPHRRCLPLHSRVPFP